MDKNSNFSKFYQNNREERLSLLVKRGFFSSDSAKYLLDNKLLSDEVANNLIENQVGQFPLPFGIALNFTVDGDDTIIPMVTEEPSVIAACSNAAKYIRNAGGFVTEFEERYQTGQIIFYHLSDFNLVKKIVERNIPKILEVANNAHPSIVARGGGVKSIECKIMNNELEVAEYLTIFLYIDVQEAMGANIVNTILEDVGFFLEGLLNGERLMSILSNYNDRSLVSSNCRVLVSDLSDQSLSGIDVAKRIVEASKYAKLDPYRAVTHNKGIMNGIDAVVMATGNDWRAVEAGIHAFASKDGKYQGLTTWKLSDDGVYLEGSITIPVMIGSVGGAISVLPLSKLSQELLGTASAVKISKIIASVGLAQNFAALKALVTEGIQKGHMGLHTRSLAIHAGATETEIEELSDKLKQIKKMNLATAKNILEDIRKKR